VTLVRMHKDNPQCHIYEWLLTNMP
jgi:hypothetical protein